jgi:hypothetical protein
MVDGLGRTAACHNREPLWPCYQDAESMVAVRRCRHLGCRLADDQDFDAVHGRSSQPFEPNDIAVVDRTYAKLGKTRESIRQNEVAPEIIEGLIVKR